MGMWKPPLAQDSCSILYLILRFFLCHRKGDTSFDIELKKDHGKLIGNIPRVFSMIGVIDIFIL